MANKDVTSEKECISGNPSLGSMANPNVMAGAEETISPSIYDRGVVRICATANPGLKTSPARFVDVGYCDDTKIRCWLDKNSVDNAITDANVGIKNATLSSLEGMTDSQLEAQGFMREDEVNGEISSLNNALLRLGGSENVVVDAQIILDRIDNIVWDMLWFNSHKAQVLLIKGQVRAIVAEKLWMKEAKASVISSTTSGAGQSGTGKYIFMLNDIKDESKIQRLQIVGEGDSNYYVNSSDGSLYYGEKEFIGSVSDTGEIILYEIAPSLISSDEIKKVEGANVRDWYVDDSEDTEENVAGENSVEVACDDCRKGLFNGCGKDECIQLNSIVNGGCYFVDNAVFDKCLSCSAITKCSDYSADEENCVKDACSKKLSCQIVAGGCVEDVTEEVVPAVSEEIKYYGIKTFGGVKIITLGGDDNELSIFITSAKIIRADNCIVGAFVSSSIDFGKINIVDDNVNNCKTLDEKSRVHLNKINGNFVNGTDIIDGSGKKISNQ